MSDTLVAVLVGVAMAVGLVGTVLPVLPGLALIWIAALVFGLASGFEAVGIIAMLVITALAVAATVAGAVIPKRAAGAAGAARQSLLIGAALGVIGFFVIPIIGFPLGGALGIYVGEQLRTGDRRLAWQATRATLAGFGLAALVQLGAGIVMVLTWAVWLVAV